jgi:hypothetical protein
MGILKWITFWKKRRDNSQDLEWSPMESDEKLNKLIKEKDKDKRKLKWPLKGEPNKNKRLPDKINLLAEQFAEKDCHTKEQSAKVEEVKQCTLSENKFMKEKVETPLERELKVLREEIAEKDRKIQEQCATIEEMKQRAISEIVFMKEEVETPLKRQICVLNEVIAEKDRHIEEQRGIIEELKKPKRYAIQFMKTQLLREGKGGRVELPVPLKICRGKQESVLVHRTGEHAKL